MAVFCGPSANEPPHSSPVTYSLHTVSVRFYFFTAGSKVKVHLRLSAWIPVAMTRCSWEDILPVMGKMSGY